ncbi:unnamed protein product [Caenorhabditis nigoni]
MLNATCQIEEDFVVTVFHWICLFTSFPIYTVAFIVLLTKCPEHFNEYRKLLVIHIISKRDKIECSLSGACSYSNVAKSWICIYIGHAIDQ